MRLAKPKQSSAIDLERELVDRCRREVCPLFGDPSFEVVGQRNAKGSGSTRGFVDVVVGYCGWWLPMEFKNPDGTGVMSGDQQAMAKWRWENGVDTVVIESVQQFADVLGYCRRHPVEQGVLPHSLIMRMERR